MIVRQVEIGQVEIAETRGLLADLVDGSLHPDRDDGGLHAVDHVGEGRQLRTGGVLVWGGYGRLGQAWRESALGEPGRGKGPDRDRAKEGGPRLARSGALRDVRFVEVHG